jgi:hypothetical protein
MLLLATVFSGYVVHLAFSLFGLKWGLQSPDQLLVIFSICIALTLLLHAAVRVKSLGVRKGMVRWVPLVDAVAAWTIGTLLMAAGTWLVGFGVR